MIPYPTLSFGAAQPQNNFTTSQPLGYPTGYGSISQFGQAPAVPQVQVPQVTAPQVPSVGQTMATTGTGMPQIVAGTDSLAMSLGQIPGLQQNNTELPAVPGSDVGGGFLSNFYKDGQLNFENLGSLAKGIAGLGGMWMAYQQNGLAQEAFDFQKSAYKTNLANSISDYNRSLEDQVRARYHQEGRSSADVQRYVDKHRLEA